MKMLLPDKIGGSGKDNDAMSFLGDDSVKPSHKGFGSGVAVDDETSCGVLKLMTTHGAAGTGRGMSLGSGYLSSGSGYGYH